MALDVATDWRQICKDEMAPAHFRKCEARLADVPPYSELWQEEHEQAEQRGLIVRRTRRMQMCVRGSGKLRLDRDTWEERRASNGGGYGRKK